MALQAEVRSYRWVAWGLHTLVEIELAAGDMARAVAYYEELGTQFGEIWGRWFQSNDGLIQLARGDVAGGIETLLDAVARFAAASEIEAEIAMRRLGGACVVAGGCPTAVRLYAAAAGIRERRGLGLSVDEAREIDTKCARLRSDLGEEVFEQEWSAGTEMTVGEIAAYAGDVLEAQLP
jgi:hypothetical protein